MITSTLTIQRHKGGWFTVRCGEKSVVTNCEESVGVVASWLFDADSKYISWPEVNCEDDDNPTQS